MSPDILSPSANLGQSYFLEASAGTGKTYAIEHLVAKMVDEGTPLERILVVTFTRAAARQLKERIGRLLQGIPFDEAKIFTIHAFCLEMLSESGAEVGLLDLERAAQLQNQTIRNLIQSGELGVDELKMRDDAALISSFAKEEIVLSRLRAALQEEGIETYDTLMEKAVAADLDWDRFDVVIVDEFQDTDRIQWEIFEGFLKTGRPFIAVGDPKQSIYLFRNADIQTYLHARDTIGHSQTLGVNYRSRPGLIAALNTFFDGASFGEGIPYHPVEAGVSEDNFLSREEPLQFMVAEGKLSRSGARFPTEKMEEELFFPFIANEITKLRKEGGLPFSHFCILIRDRFQAQRLKRFMKGAGIPIRSSRGLSPRDSEALKDLREVVAATLNLGDRARLKVALGGRILGWKGADLEAFVDRAADAITLMKELRMVLTSQGLIPFVEQLLTRFEAAERLLREGGADYLEEIYQIAALVGDRDPLHGLEALERSDEARLFPGSDRDGVEVMTIFGSKGLEFGVVFPLALASRSPKGDLDKEEEKKRLLYVALTRAKDRIYIPIAIDSANRKIQEGTAAPMELFLEGRRFDQFPQRLLKPESFLSVKESEQQNIFPPPVVKPHFAQRWLQSFSGLAQTGEHSHSDIEVTLPAGKETGNLLHDLLERLPLPFEKGPWIADQLEGTAYEEWTGEIESMIWETFHADLGGFSLVDVDPTKIWREKEFLFSLSETAPFAGRPVPSGMVTGVIDLFFEHEEKFYLVDWKSNALPSYDQETLRGAMEEHDYFLQFELYLQAVGRYLARIDERPLSEIFGGGFYIFLRGGVFRC